MVAQHAARLENFSELALGRQYFGRRFKVWSPALLQKLNWTFGVCVECLYPQKYTAQYFGEELSAVMRLFTAFNRHVIAPTP